MKAIFTKYLPATNTRGARIKAIAGISITVPFPYDARHPHDAAAVALAQKCGWKGAFIRGAAPDSSPYSFCYVFANDDRVEIPAN